MEEDIKFLIDVGVGKKVEIYLKQIGYDAKTIRELDIRMKDIEILKIAVKDERTVITMDKGMAY